MPSTRPKKTLKFHSSTDTITSRQSDETSTRYNSIAEKSPRRENFCPESCFNTLQLRAQLDGIRSRVEQGHYNKALELTEAVTAAQEQQQKKRKTSEAMTFRDEEDEEEEFAEIPASMLVMKQSAKDRANQSAETLPPTAVMKRLGLVKEDVFTGVEADALKNLLRTLRWKAWDPQLYFHIRFFSIRHKLYPMSKETKVLVKSRWHLILRMLSTMAKIEQVLADRSFEMSQECVTCIDMIESAIHPIYWGNNPNLCFDKGAFKVHTNHTMLSIDVQQTFRKNPEERTPAEIDQAVLNLQYVDDFAKFPAEVQYRVAESAFYIWLGSNRVILRQGHIAQNYYFVLLGRAVCKRFLENGKTETTAILRKGKGFGSVSIFNRCPRHVTVVSQTPIHLLVVPKEVILANFDKNEEEIAADVIVFLSKMWFMQSWPLECLYKCFHQCRRKTFRRTEIMETDGVRSEWLYVVMSGSFKIYERVVEPKKTPKRSTVVMLNEDRLALGERTLPRVSSRTSGTSATSLGSTPSKTSARSGCRGSSHQQKSITENTTPSGTTLYSILSQKMSVSATTVTSNQGPPDSMCSEWSRTHSYKAGTAFQNYNYKWVKTMRYLDVFGLDDTCLDTKHPPSRKYLLLVSDGVECAMLCKNFYLQLSRKQLRQKVYKRVMSQQYVHSQITKTDCSLIPLGGIQKKKDVMQDPIDPVYCIHC